MPPAKKSKATSAPSSADDATPSAVPATAAPKSAAPENKASAASKPVSSSKPAEKKSREVTYEMIRDRAYFISINRSWDAGTEDGDWHEAERQLRSEL